MAHLESTGSSTNASRHGSLAGAWLISLRSENTRKAYRRDLHELFTFLDAHGLDALTAGRAELDVWRNALTGANTTVARKLAAASSFYRYAQSEGATERNPVALIVRPAIDRDHSPTAGMTLEQARVYLEQARKDGARSFAFTSLLLFTGIRESEALEMHTGDLGHDGGHRVAVIRRKGGKSAKIVIPPPAVDALSQLIGASLAQGTELTTREGEGERRGRRIFTTRSGKAWAPSEAFRTVRRIARDAGIPGNITPHSFRHTHATLALDGGASLVDLQDSLGQADPRTTRRYDKNRNRLARSSS